MRRAGWVVGICVASITCLSGFQIQAADAMLPSVGAETVLDIKPTTDDILPDVGAARVLDRIDEEALWGYLNLGIAHVDNHLNIRAVAAEDGKLVGKMTKDAACEIIGFDGDWAHIKSGKVDGYVSKEFLYIGEEAKKRGSEVVQMMAIVTTDTLKVRDEPNTECKVITLVPNGEELEVVQEGKDGWVEIMLDDETAYISGDYVKIEPKLQTAVTMTELLYGEGVSNVRVDLCQYAKQFVGNRYVWGGTSLEHGTDCSGFTLSVFRKYGVSLPRTASQQSRVGTKVNPTAAQPGDLFFYAKGGRVNHVAIYIGNGQVVHASNPRSGIKISNAFYRTPYVVKRIIKQ
ncbi:MAG: NlpC/P60 family protein [Lachnospiraceae bacterium]